MNLSGLLSCIDSHAGGMPNRIVIGGLPHVPGRTMADKERYLSQERDDVRQLLMSEPRGSATMAGVIVTEPVTAEADCGLIWIEPWGYPPGCGHGTIATATALAEAGILTPHGADNELVFDTVPGPICVRLSLAGGKVKQVSVTYVPSFLQLDGATIQVEPWGKLTVDVAWGGCYYAILPASAIGLQVNRASYRSLVEAGKRLLPAVNGQLEVQHPEFPDIRQVHYVQFSGPPSLPEAHARNMVYLPPDSADRSPCGTGTCARMATLYARGELALNQDFGHESIVSSLFVGRLVGTTKVGPYQAVIPTLSGCGFITGLQQFVLDPTDPLPRGFLLG
jgi:proline racemase